MLIFYSKDSEPMLLDSVSGLSELAQKVFLFSSSDLKQANFPAKIGNPEPYECCLNGLRINKTLSANKLTLEPDGWLVLSAPENEIAEFSKKLMVKIDNDHVHWHSSPLSLIIEADDWRASSES